ncbi:MAG: ligase [Chloroflexota bacterium]|nr:ligase [Chloroflexota bacterium]
MTSEAWRLLPYHTGPSDLHIALSDALTRCSTVPTLWWHATDRPTLILGGGQSWEQADIEACRRSGTRVLRRHAGGTAVFAAAGVLGLDVALPAGHPLAGRDVVEAYRWLGEMWVRTLQALGVEAHLVTIEEARMAGKKHPLNSAVRMACFGSLSPYEVTIEGRKLIGLAQVRRRAGSLLQSGLHLRFDPESLAASLRCEDRQALSDALRSAAIGLNEVGLGHLGEGEVMKAFGTSLRETLAIRIQPGDWSAAEWEHALDTRFGVIPHSGM